MKTKLLSLFLMCCCLNTYGQNICVGKIIYIPDPTNLQINAVFGVKTGTNDYILTVNSHYINYDDHLIIGDTEYFFCDNIVITGTTSIKPSVSYGEYLEIEIETIEKLSSNRDIQNYLGIYDIRIDCTKSWWIGDNATLSIIAETDVNAAFDIRLFFEGQFGGDGFWGSLLNDNSFVIENWNYHEGGVITEHTSGVGYRENDSIFINFQYYDRQWINYPFTIDMDCHCKGKKISTGIISTSDSKNNKVYYDTTKQLIIIDETLQHQSLIFELSDLQGKVILKHTNIGNYINMANLPTGVYLFRLLQNSQVIYCGKILR